MLKLLKKIPWNKIKFKRRLRSADELFTDGKIFEARDKELDNILKELTCKNVAPQSKEVIRAITVLSIKNNKYKNLIEFFLIILTIFSLFLAWKQFKISEQTSLPILIEQNTLRRQAIEYCKLNPDSPDSGLSYTDGKQATCKEILNSNLIKTLK